MPGVPAPVTVIVPLPPVAFGGRLTKPEKPPPIEPLLTGVADPVPS